MNIKYFQRSLSLSLALGSFLISLGTASQAQAQAQLSDITGAIITTSDIADGIYPSPNGQRTLIVFRTPAVATAVNQAAQSTNGQLAAQTLPIVVRDIPTTSLSSTVQQTLASVVTGSGTREAATTQLESGLIRGLSGVNSGLIRNLVTRLDGLTAGGEVNAAQLQAAVNAYNALINASNANVLSDPPEELLAIQSILSTLVTAALRAV
ncbi:MAG TPA: hypothetical protein DD379_09325 [Cyanobacteria bacterium UBA11162]|nr:hypothetical protein [Cyanobacteria bacterium UBA11162]